MTDIDVVFATRGVKYPLRTRRLAASLFRRKARAVLWAGGCSDGSISVDLIPAR